MPTSINKAVQPYFKDRNSAAGTRNEYQKTLKNWQRWRGRVPLERLNRSAVREFLQWVHDRAVANGGSNAWRTAYNAGAQLQAVVSWAWENDLIQSPPDSHSRFRSVMRPEGTI